LLVYSISLPHFQSGEDQISCEYRRKILLEGVEVQGGKCSEMRLSEIRVYTSDQAIAALSTFLDTSPLEHQIFPKRCYQVAESPSMPGAHREMYSSPYTSKEAELSSQAWLVLLLKTTGTLSVRACFILGSCVTGGMSFDPVVAFIHFSQRSGSMSPLPYSFIVKVRDIQARRIVSTLNFLRRRIDSHHYVVSGTSNSWRRGLVEAKMSQQNRSSQYYRAMSSF
jgi:hypothetical protein